MKNNEKLIAQVIPAIKLPNNITQVFSYAVPDKFEKKIQVGMLVEVFFRNKKIVGAVYNLKKEEPGKIGYKLKSVEDLLDKSPGLSEEQIQLAEFISNYYYTPLSLVIKTIIPPITKKEARKEIELNRNRKIAEIKKTEVNKFLKKIKLENKILFIHNLQAERHILYFNIIKNTLKKDEQALILLPEYFDIYNFAGFYKNKFGENKIAILTSDLTKNQYFDEWKKIKNGTAKIIIGTRQAVFAPFQNLKLIIADDEHNSSYKQWDMNPRYHGIKAAEKLAEIWKTKIILSSPAPSVESYYKIKSKLYECGVLNCHCPAPRNDSNKNLNLIDLNAERQKGNYSVLSEDLKNSLMENIYQRKQAIIFIPRLGNNTVTQCKDCGWIAECKNCKAQLISYANYLYCQRCREKISSFKECPKCKGQNIRSYGYGSEKIEQEIKKLFQNKNIKISRLDSDVVDNKNKQLKIYKDFISEKIDILIGTQMVLKNWGLENLALTAILFPEIIFNQSDFKTKEKSFQFLMSACNKAGKNHKIIIQTYRPDNNIFKFVEDRNLDKFYADEIKNRLAISKTGLGYPPFTRLIKLIYKDLNPKNCQAEAERMFRILESKIKNNQNLKNKFEIIKPFPAANYKEFNKYRWHIIIKSVCENIKLRDSLLNLVKKNWIVDIDPDGVL